MFKEEAYWIKSVLLKIPLSDGNIANLGSSTKHFRTIIQPHINQNIIVPLEERGLKITNIDIKKEEGVDIQADLTSKYFSKQVGGKYDLILCTNMLEHVESISNVIDNLVQIVNKDGYILITVPRKYPIHLDPIDNKFRPKPKEISDLFNKKTKYTIIESKIIQIKDIDSYPIKKSSMVLWRYRKRFRFWLKKYYSVSGILLQINKFY